MLVCDIGNTQTVLGYFEEDLLLKSFRINTDSKRTGDEYRILIKEFLEEIGIRWEDFRTITLSSVVPRATDSILRLKDEKRILTVGHKSRLSFKLNIPEPETLGADRISDMEGAIKKYSAPFIIVDCGTAVTFDVVNEKSEYIGGAIAPGIYTSADALFARASKLFSTILSKPENVIGTNTKTQLQSGIVNGWASLIDGMVWKIKKELSKDDIKVIGTGGQIEFLGDAAASIDTIDKDLTLEGLLEIYKNETKKGA